MATKGYTYSKPINVYLKFQHENQANTLIKHFNQNLSKNRALTPYHIMPFIDRYPLHVTLYLARYHEKEIPHIISRVQQIAEKQLALSLVTDQFIVNQSGYVMLTIHNDIALNKLSHSVLNSLVDLRDKHSKIPKWAANDAGRQRLFQQYGSPNVGAYFNPHFSIFEPLSFTPIQQSYLYKTLLYSIKEYSKTQNTQVRLTASAIGIGITNHQGQIIKELKSFVLNKPLQHRMNQ